MNTLKLVIVGHVDHGKSTLIGRLLYDTDSLPPDKIAEIKKASRDSGQKPEFAHFLDYLEEERREGITIDTTQVFFKSDKRRYVIIDVPGHVEFVKNMVTGASYVQAAVLIIDVKEGLKEQTKRHAYILAMLGIEQVMVVLNKMDLLHYGERRFEGVKKAIQKFLGSLNINADCYIPISAAKGDNVAQKSENMDWYHGLTLLESLDSLRSRRPATEKPLIFPVQDVYQIDNKKVAVGKIAAGNLKKGQAIKVLPSGRLTKIKSIEKFLEDVDKSYTGESIGIITDDPLSLDRGNVICDPAKEPPLIDTFRADVFWLAKENFNKKEKITLRCATQEVTCKVKNIKKRIDSSTLKVIARNSDKLKNLEVGEVIIETKRPIVVKKFNEVQELGRFVFVRAQDVCAGGIITSY